MFSVSVVPVRLLILVLVFFNDSATTEIYTLSLHDALPISLHGDATRSRLPPRVENHA